MSHKLALPHVALARLTQLGFHLSELLCKAGIAVDNQHAPLQLSIAQYSAFFRAVADLAPDPLIGLTLGQADNISALDSASFAAIHSANFAAALQRLASYNRLVCPKELSIKTYDNTTAVSLTWLNHSQAVEPILIDALFANLCQLLQFGLKEKIAPVKIHLERSEVPTGYADFFACPVLTQAGKNEIYFDNALLDRPFSTYNPDLLSLILPSLDKQLPTEMPTLSEQVRQLLYQMMNGERPNIERLAEKLHMSQRTLQRKLSAQGTSYQQLLDSVRHQLACEMLTQTQMENGEIAFYLGFAELNSFHRFFQQKQGCSPSEFRQNNIGVI